MTDFRCFSLYFYFKVLDADTYGGKGSVGYTRVVLDESTGSEKLPIDEIVSTEGFKKISESYRKITADLLEVPLENIISISRDEYNDADDEGEE